MTSDYLPKNELLKLTRYNTPAVYNGWEQITKHDVAKGHFNLNEVTDYTPELGPTVGYAVTVKIEPSNKKHKVNKAEAVKQYRRYLASIPGPKIVVIEDLDGTPVGSFWGEVNATIHRSLGVVGTLVDGAVRDITEMKQTGLKVLSKRLCVGHAHVTPLEWGETVNAFGCEIASGQLIHMDQHGFLAVPKEDEKHLLEATEFMDENELDTVIPSGWNTWGLTEEEMIKQLEAGGKEFSRKTYEKFQSEGEW